MASVTFQDVSLTYEGVQREIEALGSLSFSIDHGEPLAIIGPSGCGKSSSLLLMAGLLQPTRGTVLVDGTPQLSPRRETALILQEYGLLPWKTVADNAGLGLEIRGVSKRTGSAAVAEALATVGLSEFAHAYPGELSGGMRQRVALARVLTLGADLLLMDEPLSALDSLTREELQDTLLTLWRQRGHTQVLVTHSIEEAAFLGRTIIVMTPRPGRVLRVVDNPGMGECDYRRDAAFFEVCAELRAALIEEAAQC